jgi:hypothetical protein
MAKRNEMARHIERAPGVIRVDCIARPVVLFPYQVVAQSHERQSFPMQKVYEPLRISSSQNHAANYAPTGQNTG